MKTEDERITVDANALRQILVALNGPSYHIAELQVTRGLSKTFDSLEVNPIDKLTDEFNAWVAIKNSEGAM